ncbi:Insecticidal toxin complex protein TccB1 [hydrothermal vent metagenome]|uniref:Insecticidal toxin complex protein TccB1 n=1 Tax=hydrothermal vent metagenome TaxID=652676 RepID=A0A3B0YDE2_9ZZZZ
MKRLEFQLKTKTRSSVANLHTALRLMEIDISEEEIKNKKLGTSTKKAIEKFQKKHDLSVDGDLGRKTLAVMNAELFDRHVSLSKTRTSKLHVMLDKLDSPVSENDKAKRQLGRSTRNSIKELQKKMRLTEDGKLSDKLFDKIQEAVIKKTLSTKTQVGKLQATMLKVNEIAKLNIKIESEDISTKKLGESSKNWIKAFQKKYKLKADGKINQPTLDKINSVASSKGKYVKKLKAPQANELKTVTKNLRLNMVSPFVAEIQKSLSFLGYKVAQKEFNTQAFGKTTTKSIKTLQKRNGLVETGHFDKATSKLVNSLVLSANPDAGLTHRYRIRGSVRDELWDRKNSMVIKFYEKILDKESVTPLGAKKNFLNGFFDIPYDAPIDITTGKIKEKFHLVIRLYDENDQNTPLAEQIHNNVKATHWVNFTATVNSDGITEYTGNYAGKSDYEVTKKLLQKALGPAKIADLHETETDKQITQLSIQSGLSTDDIMCHVLSQLVEKSVNAGTLTDEAFYAFIRQNLPADLPGDLLRGTSDWDTIDNLVELTESGLMFLDDSTQQQAIDNAITQNLVSQKIKISKTDILAELQTQRNKFTLTKPILVGNGSLQSLLDESTINSSHYSIISAVFISSNGVNPEFWEEIKTHEAVIGAAAIADFTTTVEAGNITKNHIPTVTFLKNNIGSEEAKPFKTASDIAKLDQQGLVALVGQNGKQVPDNMPGDTVDDKVDNFAAAMVSRTELLFPAVSLVATIKRSGTAKITKINEIEIFIDEQKDLNFKKQNIDQFLVDNPTITLADKTIEELKVVQRTHKLTANSLTGSSLIEEGLHSSMQIYFTGKDRLVSMLEAKGVRTLYSSRVYEASKLQYMRVVARLTDFRREMHRTTPQAIVLHTYSDKEVLDTIGDIPNLKSLFGSLDYCECEHCKSLYSPSAYLTDMLRFLKSHDAVEVGKKVKDILFERRPDIGNVKLNCTNTNTPLPYIDLVCEILENYLVNKKDFVLQTTLTQAELRAIPEYIQDDAYAIIANADFPLNNSFNLWQEETRTYLDYLQVPRYELMEVFQDKSDTNSKVPGDVAIAAEYFSISSKEKYLIVNMDATEGGQDDYWGFVSTQTSLQVSLFLKRSKLNYYELIELLQVQFVNNPGSSPSKIVRDVETCDVDQQTINNVTIAKLDLMHRFIRLWRKTGWKMWELDLLIRTLKIGNNEIDEQTLVNLKSFRELQDRLRLPFEILLAFYGDTGKEINREIRVSPDSSDVIINPLYNQLFQNVSVTNPIDERFKAINSNHEPISLDSTINIGLNEGGAHNGYTPIPTILSALALQQTDFDLLLAKTSNLELSIVNLSIFLKYTYLARSLKLTVTDLMLFLDITNNLDPFSSLETTIESFKSLEKIQGSGVSLLELDYVLNYKPDSPIGLRDETTVQFIDVLRGILQVNKDNIDQLDLAIADQEIITNFDTEALAGMNDAQVVVALGPLNAILGDAIATFTSVSFSVEESNLILNYDTNSITADNKNILASNIEALQQNVTNLLDSNENQITSHIAGTFGMTDVQVAVALGNIEIPAGPTLLRTMLEDESLISKDAEGNYTEIDSTNFPGHFSAYYLLHKVSLLVLKMDIETENFEWFVKNSAEINTLDFSTLPVLAVVDPNNFSGWLNLLLFLQFKSSFPEPEDASIRSILELAKDDANSKEDIFSEIATLTQWDMDEISAIHAGLNIQHAAGQLDYTDAEIYTRLQKCFQQMRLTGVDVSAMLTWANINTDLEVDKEVAIQTRQAVKSKYEQQDWLAKVTPLHDAIREKKRTALVEYHIEKSLREVDPELENGVITNPLYWKDTNALYKYFLIDVEMSACQLTSRIKQSISSVQLFVQRCFLNLENRFVVVTQDQKDDKSSPNAWSQWKWMKIYRVWEANRKIFFYPENWLEPELRDDKSPFFRDLENELLQNEITDENVEQAFQNYLHKVDDVSHLEVMGMYHQMEDLGGEEIYATNIVHVIARTKTEPQTYYYRSYDMIYHTWSAWSPIEVDITGDQVMPVVYNRRLYLFWLQFTEKPMKSNKTPAAHPSSSNEPIESADPMKLLEVKLGWSYMKGEAWTSKKTSKLKLIHPWGRPTSSYNLKPYYLAKYNELHLDIYISTSREFNNGNFYDPNVTEGNNPIRITKYRFNETYLPWHSSSFIFDGEVKDVKMKGLSRHYNYFGKNPSLRDSYEYVHAEFGSDGEDIKRLAHILESGPRLKLPTGMHYKNTHLTNNLYNAVNNNLFRVLENAATSTLLSGANAPFGMVFTQQELQLDTVATSHPIFYQDSQRSFFVKPEWVERLDNYGRIISETRKYRFEPFYHPYTVLFIRELNRDGMKGLLSRDIQIKPQSFSPKNNFNFSSYAPSPKVIVGGSDPTAQKSTDIVDFSFGAANSIYNWELFFHAPLMVANRLMQNQKFEEAMKWFHYIFNPTSIEDYPSPKKYWVTKPFFEYNAEDSRIQRIESILSNLDLDKNSDQIAAWKNNPFNPHVIARYRPVAYQKNVVMKYIDNLIAWGDMLFKRDSIESINEASLLYMLAYEILGERPQKVPNVEHEELTFNEIEQDLDDFGNVRVDAQVEDSLLPISIVPASSESESIPSLDVFYFCIPHNDFLSKYWDTVEDRLFKIRHCMNIQGIVRQLPLFQPPIDPALLVKAAANGMDLSSVLSDLSAPTPHYRFRIVVQKAVEFCNQVRGLGEKLLSALEKKDVEGLSLLRSQHEIQLLEAVKSVREKQIDEAAESIGSLNMASAAADTRKSYYDGLPRMNEWEIGGTVLHGLGVISDIVATVLNTVGAVTQLIPTTFTFGAAGFGGSPVFTTTYGADNISKSSVNFAALFQGLSSILHSSGSMLETQASYTRRDNENAHQSSLAAIEKEQIQFQINAAEIRKAITEKELDNQVLQIDNAKTTNEYMRNKYTDEQLYSWMITQISTVYFQAYQLAFDMAKKAEKCYQHELGISNSNIIQFGYWDSLKKGLLSGDKLMNDLSKLEAEYLDQNKREFEITKHISLAQFSPLSLMTLKETGNCSISIPEWLFDMDYPGHYMRRIKSVSISIPCVVGPYTSINCTLSLQKNETRIDITLPGGTYEQQEDDIRFKTMYGEISSIATSNAQNDSGMFELNFNDERYLPFEGLGVISDWQIDMPIENNFFDFASLSDVILHISYTSRGGGGLLADAAHVAMQSQLPTETARLFSLKHEFSTEWYRFLNPENGSDQEFIVTLEDRHFPFFIRGNISALRIKGLHLFAESDEASNFLANIKLPNLASLDDRAVDKDMAFNNVHHFPADFSAGPAADALGEVKIKLKKIGDANFTSLLSDDIDNIFILFQLGT